jgi:glycosyltransferase involved in cell wall biosynthesis
MPEIAGDAAAIVDPYKPEEIVSAIEHILNDTAYRNDLCAKGIERASTFSWKHMAEKYLELYHQMLTK